MVEAIEIRALSKYFGATKAVDGMNLSVRRGEMFAIVGPDGAGKTTLIRMLCGVLEPTSGNAHLLGFDIVKEIEEIKRRIGYLSQKFSLYGDLSIDENIEFFAEIHQVADYKARRDELLDFTRLAPFRHRLAGQLSGGMKQKLALACTLIHTPDIIFLDEPTTGVDPVSRRDFWKILSNLLKTGITIVMTTPYLDEAERCHRVALMTEGKAIEIGTPQEIKQKMKGEIVEILCENVRKASQIIRRSALAQETQTFGDRLNVVVADHALDIPPILAVLTAENITVQEWRVVPPSLENVFISLLQR